MNSGRTETDSLRAVQVPADKLWGAHTQRSVEHFSIGHDLFPNDERRMVGTDTSSESTHIVRRPSGGLL